MTSPHHFPTDTPFSRSETNYVAMGRFGNVLLINGEPELSLTARLGCSSRRRSE